MRVAQVTPRYAPRTGGVETHVEWIARELVDRGHEVTVVTADAGSDVPRRERRDGVAVRRCRGIAPGGAVHVAPGVALAVARLDADLVHAHNYHSLPLSFAAVGAGDRPFVVTPHYHGGSADPLRDRLLAAYRPVGGRALRRADAVVAVSDWERRRLRGDFGVAARVIPNGLDVDRFRDAAPRERDGDRPYLCCVGRLERYKGVDRAIRALAELPAYDLLVAGDGPYRETAERAARVAGVADRVRFLGYVADEELPGLYAGAAAHLALSTHEAYGMTVAEALAAGTPCVVREAGALTDWIERPCVVGVSDPTPGRTAAAVRDAVGCEPEPESLPAWDAVTESLLEVYGDLLGIGSEGQP